MVMTRRERLAYEASQLKLITSSDADKEEEAPKEESASDLLTKMSAFSTSKHIPLKDVMAVLRIPTDSIIR